MKKHLFKKVAAFVTAASMVASLGTVAFADNYYESGIKITNVNYQRADVEGEYDVTVSYLVDDGVINDIGVTMLAYTGANLSVDTVGYTTYDNATMQIVGIDQHKQKDQTGSFEFRVTTNGDSDAIKVDYNVPSIILVSGDKVTPAAATLLIEKQKQKITADSAEYTYEGDVIPYYSYEKAGLKDKVTTALAVMSDTATLKDTDGNVIGTAPITGANIKTVVEKDADTYTVTATIPAGTVTSGSYDVIIPAGGLDAVFDVAVGLMPWAVVSANYNAENTMTIEPQADADAVVTAIEAKLAEAGVTLKGEDEKAVKKLVGDDLDVTVAIAGDAAYDPNNTEDQVLTYNVEVNFPGDAEAAVPEESVLTFELTVTVSAIPAGTYGDVDNSGVVDMSDAAEIMRYYLGYDSSFKVDAIYVDVDNSGVIDMSDAAKIMQYYLGYITSLPDES